MVALAVRYFWQRPVICNARQLLYKAHASLDRGSTIEAGCHLREAMRAYLHAECEYCGCLPKQKRSPAPRVLSRALKRAGHHNALTYAWISELIEVGNKAAHLVMVEPSTIARALETIHAFLDDSPYLIEAQKGGR